jgi:nitroimidazol reductase NimA-like FMN-containing flavoprotein (pyridoxamine 5'-phosphate oxidase superfamily)
MANIVDADFLRVRRLPEKQVDDRAVAYSILDAGLIAHVGVPDGDVPIVVPVGYARFGDSLVVHGSSGSRLFRLLAGGAPACITVTLLDGLVAARSMFESSMHYRSVMVFGTGERLEGADELSALQAFSDHVMPGRWGKARIPTKKELAATSTIRFPLTHYSVKVSASMPDDDPEDLVNPELMQLWAGVLPITTVPGTPIRDAHTPDHTPVPEYLSTWVSSTGR